MVYCPDCGRKNPDDADVCAYCGAQIHPWESSTKEPVKEKEREVERTEKDQGHNKVLLLAVIGIVAIVVIVGLLALGGIFSGDDGESTPSLLSPDVDLTASPTSGYASLDVIFSLSASDSDGAIASWELDIDNDDSADYSGSGAPPATQSHTYQNCGVYPAILTVQDNDGKTSSDNLQIVVYVGEATFDVNIDLNQGKPVFTVYTNLPERMEFLFTVTNPAIDYRAQDSPKVVNSKIIAGPFSDNYQPLPSGTYTLEITSPLVQIQPSEVQQILGENGEYVNGKYISEGRIDYEDTFTVP